MQDNNIIKLKKLRSERLNKAIKALGYNQPGQFADKHGIGRTTIYGILREGRKPHSATEKALYRAGINTIWLETGEGPMLLHSNLGSKAQYDSGSLESLLVSDKTSVKTNGDRIRLKNAELYQHEQARRCQYVAADQGLSAAEMAASAAKAGFDGWRTSDIKAFHSGNSAIEPRYLSFLAAQYNVNLEWLLLFTDSPAYEKNIYHTTEKLLQYLDEAPADTLKFVHKVIESLVKKQEGN